MTFDVRNPTCFAVWLSVFFPQIVGPKIVASDDSTALPLLISNSTDVQLNVLIKNAKVKKKKKAVFQRERMPKCSRSACWPVHAPGWLTLAPFTNGTQCPSVFCPISRLTNRAQFAGVFTKYHLGHYLGVGRRELGFYS